MDTVFSEADKTFMKRALKLAGRGRGTVNPNPMVGAVLVKNGTIIGEGFHRVPGEPHGEINALKKAVENPSGSTLYVTLEPCNHYGRTPPCTEAIIKADIKKVIIAATDKNPGVTGNGAARLRMEGIEVKTGLYEEEARELNRSYEKFVATGYPFVSLKVAATADGKIATVTGLSKWITGKLARRYVHELRRLSDAVLVGIGTVLADDPLLTVREVPLKRSRPPMRVVLDSHLAISGDAQIISPAPHTILFTTEAHDKKKAGELKSMGVEVITAGTYEGKVDIDEVLRELGKRNVVDLLVEGGASINSSFIERSKVDYLYLFVAPKVFGGRAAPSWVAGDGAASPESGKMLRWEKIKRIGDDLLIEARPYGGTDVHGNH